MPPVVADDEVNVAGEQPGVPDMVVPRSSPEACAAQKVNTMPLAGEEAILEFQVVDVVAAVVMPFVTLKSLVVFAMPIVADIDAYVPGPYMNWTMFDDS